MKNISKYYQKDIDKSNQIKSSTIALLRGGDDMQDIDKKNGIKMEDKKDITLRLPENIYEALKDISKKTGINLTNLILVILWKKILNI